MDFPISPSGDDITSVVKMVKDFKSFVNRPTHGNSRVSLDNSSDFFGSLNRTSSLNSTLRKRTMGQDFVTLSTEERAEMLATKSKVAKLENELKMQEFENKRKCIEDESKQRIASNQLAKETEQTDTMRRKYVFDIFVK